MRTFGLLLALALLTGAAASAWGQDTPADNVTGVRPGAASPTMDRLYRNPKSGASPQMRKLYENPRQSPSQSMRWLYEGFRPNTQQVPPPPLPPANPPVVFPPPAHDWIFVHPSRDPWYRERPLRESYQPPIRQEWAPAQAPQQPTAPGQPAVTDWQALWPYIYAQWYWSVYVPSIQPQPRPEPEGYLEVSEESKKLWDSLSATEASRFAAYWELFSLQSAADPDAEKVKAKQAEIEKLDAEKSRLWEELGKHWRTPQ